MIHNLSWVALYMTSCIPRLDYSTTALRQKLLTLVCSSTVCWNQGGILKPSTNRLLTGKTVDITHEQHNYLCEPRLSPRWSWWRGSLELRRGVILQERYDVSGYPDDGAERYHEMSYLSYNITPCLFHQVWGWDRQDTPKRRIFPTKLLCVCSIRSDGIKRYPETSYLSYNITQRLFRQAWGWHRKIPRNVVSFLQY
jgi:hypothetical protein